MSSVVRDWNRYRGSISTAVSLGRDYSRRRIVRLVFGVYALLLFEGVLRKWVWPEHHTLLFFIRDPLVLWIYYRAWGAGLWPFRAALLSFALGLAGVVAILGLFQIVAGHDWLYAAYGMRNYFLYIPLAFIIGATFHFEDLRRLFRYTLLVAIPLVPLTFAQALAPADAPINQGFGQVAGEVFITLGVAFDVVRTQGTFTSGSGQTLFIGSLVTMVLVSWMLPARVRPAGHVALLLASFSTLSHLSVSGSRGAFVLSTLILGVAFTYAILSPARRGFLRPMLIPLIMAAFIAVIAPLLFPEALDALWERAAGAGAEVGTGPWGDVFPRIAFELLSFTDVVSATPLLGFGLGVGGNAFQMSDQAYLLSGLYLEGDYARHIIELGPVLSIGFVAWRIAFVVWLGARCVRGALTTGNYLALLLFAFIGPSLLYGPVTGQGTINGYAWLFAGFTLAATRLSARPAGSPAARAQ